MCTVTIRQQFVKLNQRILVAHVGLLWLPIGTTQWSMSTHSSSNPAVMDEAQKSMRVRWSFHLEAYIQLSHSVTALLEQRNCPWMVLLSVGLLKKKTLSSCVGSYGTTTNQIVSGGGQCLAKMKAC